MTRTNQSVTQQPQPPPKRTIEEIIILQSMAAWRGLEYADRNAELILEQARQIGELRRESK